MPGMGYRTIKTAIGAALAIWIASLMNLEFATFAAIMVIISIEQTKKKTILSMKDKFLASLLSMFLGALIFELLGYSPIVFGLFILIFVPILVRAGLQDGFVSSMVILLHLYAVQNAVWGTFLNEFYIIFIGMGIALLVNSFMPNFKKDVELLKLEIEQKFQTILFEFSAHLRDNARTWDGKELLEVEELINQSKSIAIQDVENHLLRKENKDYYYLEMRENQLELLKQMMRIIAICTSFGLHIKQKEMFAAFLEDLSKNVHSRDTTDVTLHELEELKEAISNTDLPKTREEFEVRANLYYLIFEIENYLNLKRNLFSK
ncbi:aromatic acid exporter family protein [Sporosarcina sp. CAU 1771]